MIDFGKAQFHCDECPICEELDFWLRCAEQDGEQFPAVEYCGCRKVDGAFYRGYCEDAWSEDESELLHGSRKTGRAYRRAMRIKRRDDLVKIANYHGYNPMIGFPNYKWVDGNFVPLNQYIRFPKNSNKQRFLKKHSNRKIRRQNEVTRGNQYRKLSEYRYILF